MKKYFDHLRATRNNIIKSIEGLSLNQLNHIPEGFSNNIAWNFMHTMVTQQLLAYKLSGNTLNISNRYVVMFGKGAISKSDYNLNLIEDAKTMYLDLVDQTENDFNNGIFKKFTHYPTSYGVILNSIEDSISFNNMHEALHLGIIMSQLKLVKSLTI